MNNLPNHAHCRCMWNVRECSNNHSFNCRICGNYKGNTLTTPPTQEKVEWGKEKCKCHGDTVPCTFKRPDESTQEKELPKCSRDEKMMICYCGKCEQGDYPLPKDFKTIVDFVYETKPTQDTESWEEEFDEKFLGWTIYKPGSPASLKVKDFIKQKKQEWDFEGFKRGQKDGYEAGKNDANHNLILARTQGAEAAVAFIENNSSLGELYSGIIVPDEVLEAAKRV